MWPYYGLAVLSDTDTDSLLHTWVSKRVIDDLITLLIYLSILDSDDDVERRKYLISSFSVSSTNIVILFEFAKEDIQIKTSTSIIFVPLASRDIM